jgi:hypothetical protein
VVAAPAGVAVAREPEGVVAGLAARPHAAAHVAAHAAVCVCHTSTSAQHIQRVRESEQEATIPTIPFDARAPPAGTERRSPIEG